MRRRELTSSLLFLLVGVIYTINSMPLDRGTIIKPGPGFLPLVLGVSMIVLSAMFAWQTYRRSDDANAQIDPLIPRTAVLILLCLAFFALFLEMLGYLLASTIMLVALFRVTNFKNWAWSIGTAVIASLSTWIVFVRWLQVQMPKGIIESFLGFLN